MSIRTQIAGSGKSTAGGPQFSLFYLEQSFTTRACHCLGSGVRAKLTHGALHVDSYRFPRQAKNSREFVGGLSCSDPTKALAFSTTQVGVLRRLEELGETLSKSFMVDVRKEQKRRDVSLGAPSPRAIIRLADDRNEAKMTWGVSRHRKASDQPEVGEIVPRPSLLLGEIAARPYGRPIKAHTSIKAGVIIRAVGIEKVPSPVPSTGKVKGPVLIHAPFAARVLCRAPDIACYKTIDPHLAQGVGQNAYGKVDVFRRKDLFPKLMPRTHDGLATLERRARRRVRKLYLLNTARQLNATPLGCCNSCVGISGSQTSTRLANRMNGRFKSRRKVHETNSSGKIDAY